MTPLPVSFSQLLHTQGRPNRELLQDWKRKGGLPVSEPSQTRPSSLAVQWNEDKRNNESSQPASPLALARIVEGWDVVPKHLALLDDALVKVAAGEIRRLLVEMPPRHGKSETCSRFFPAWYLGTHPKNRIILASYGADFARTWGRKARQVLDEYGASQFGVSVAHETSAANDWELAQRGGMVTAGIGAGITGRGANVLIIDDPVKDQEEAASEVIQERNWDWYQATAKTRLEPGGSIVVIQTRWHEKDLAGRILDEEGHEWTRIRFPAIAESNDPLGRVVGDALWPERFERSALEDIRDGRIDPDSGSRRGGLSAYWWSALYQQSPSPDTGNIFRRQWWQRYHPVNLPKSMLGATFIDTAYGGDYFVAATWLTSGLNFYLARLVRFQGEFPEVVRACLDERNAVKELTGVPLPLVVEEMPGSKPVIQSLQREVPGVIPYPLKGTEKEVRARAVQHFVEGRNCYLPANEAWVGDFIEEHAAFPNGAHDDMVDTTSMALSWLSQRQSVPQRAPQAVGYRPNGHNSYTEKVKVGRA